MADRLHEAVRNRIDWTNWDALVPVPMHPRRRKRRGFNQARQLSENLADRFNLPVLTVLSKTRRTRQQSELSRADRLENLRGAFTAEADEECSTLDGILIVDDIYTTGSTLRSAAGALGSLNCTNVGGLVLARTLPEDS